MHKTLKMPTTKKKSQKNGLEMQLLNKTFFVFGSTSRIFVLAEYSAYNLRPNTGPKTFSVDHYTPLIVSDPEGEIPDPMGATSQFPNPMLVDPVPWMSLVTLDLAFKQFGKHKCPGPDGYRPIVLCHLPLKARTILIKLYTAMIALQYTPQRWCNAEVIFLPKPGKDDYTNRRPS
jgi:hypothetical protein